MDDEAVRSIQPMISNQSEKFTFGKIKDVIPARVVLYILSFTGFLVSFMMRTDMNIAMVAMVRSSQSGQNTTRNKSATIPSYCYEPNNETTEEVFEKSEGEFDWSSNVQSIIISSFYWCYVLSQVAGGVLTQKFGTKMIFGVSQLATAISSLLIPSSAGIHWSLLVVLRSIQGVASGLTWPAMYAAVGPWIPLHERSRFMSSFQGECSYAYLPDGSEGYVGFEREVSLPINLWNGHCYSIGGGGEVCHRKGMSFCGYLRAGLQPVTTHRGGAKTEDASRSRRCSPAFLQARTAFSETLERGPTLIIRNIGPDQTGHGQIRARRLGELLALPVLNEDTR